MTAASAPRSDRIASLVLVMLLGLTVVLLIDSNPNILRARLGGDLPTITLSWVLIGFLVIITSAGADVLARAHPAMQTRSLPLLNLGLVKTEIAPGFWILPSFSVIGSFAFFRLFSASLQAAAFVLALVAAGGLLLIVLLSQHYGLDRNPQVSQRGRLILQIIAYMLAFGCFSAIYYAHFRTLYAATLLGTAGALLSYALLQWTPRPATGLQAVLVGLLLGEATWALNYWPSSFLLGGVLLLAIFYIPVSLLQHHAAGTFQRRLLLEYGLVGSLLLAAVIYATLPH